MRLRSLFAAPPSYLGYPGVSNWSAPGAFEDIVADCYIFAILQRLTALRNQLKIKPNIDGLISRNVANFLLERQRQNDLIGYAVFGNVKAAALEAAEAGLIVLENLAQRKDPQRFAPAIPRGRPRGVNRSDRAAPLQRRPGSRAQSGI